MIKNLSHQTDFLGAAASGLCLIHCLLTPILFVAQTCTSTACCDSSPAWWSAIDYLFIGITFFAVFYSARNTVKCWMKFALYFSWLVLSFLVINEKMDWLGIDVLWKYLSALVLISIHLYNRRRCSKCSQPKEKLSMDGMSR